MTNQPQARPLWRVIDAVDDCLTYKQWFGGVIRAVADWLVPEESPIPPGALERVDAFENPDLYDQLEVGKALARLDLRQRLLDEAQRAEAGDP